LTQPQRIALEGLTHEIGGQVGFQPQAFLGGFMAEGAGEILDHGGELQGDALENHALGLDLGDVEDVVKDAKQALGRELGLVELIQSFCVGHAPLG
jgi:hypothetical protein